MREFVIRIGFEPMTYCLEGSCSIQLSYRTKIMFTEYNPLCARRLCAKSPGFLSETGKDKGMELIF
jgi:hypothetical protein